MGCLLHPESHNIPAVAGEDLWFCGSCGTPIKGKDIMGGRKIGKEIALRRWKIFKARRREKGYETKRISKGEFLKDDPKAPNKIIKGRNKKKKGK